jgi:hypothetical protein
MSKRAKFMRMIANKLSRIWWYTPVIPALRRLRQEDLKFQARLGYLMNSRPAWAA